MAESRYKDRFFAAVPSQNRLFTKRIKQIMEKDSFVEKQKSQMSAWTLKHTFGLAKVIPKKQVLRKGQNRGNINVLVTLQNEVQ